MGHTKKTYECLECGHSFIPHPCHMELDDNETPLLVIELKDRHSVPVIKYKGEVIDLKQRVDFSWITKTETMGGLMYTIEHGVKPTEKTPFALSSIKYKQGKFACEEDF